MVGVSALTLAGWQPCMLGEGVSVGAYRARWLLVIRTCEGSAYE